MADINLSTLLATSPVIEAVTGDEPIESVVSATSKAFTLKQLSATPIRESLVSETLTLNDQGKVLAIFSGVDAIVTIPTNAVVAFPIGATLLVRTLGIGKLTIAPSGGVTIVKKVTASFELSEQYAQCVLHKVDTNKWHLTGELSAA